MHTELTSSVFRLAIGTAILSCPLTILPQDMVPWLTRSADNARSGWNSHETTLNQNVIKTKGLVRRTIIPLVGDANGMEAQPLILPQVQTPNNGVKDVMVLPSMADFVRGVDAHDGSAIWQVQLGNPIKSTNAIDGWGINQHWGCLSTGVIDPDLKRLYQVCWVVPNADGTLVPAADGEFTDPKTAHYYMFVINVADGTLVVPPIMIQGKSGDQEFDALPRKQRAALVETTVNGVKTVFGCSGTIQETTNGAAGFCFAFDVATNSLATIMATTAGRGAGVWMAGQGPAADTDGDIYLITGNGDFDGVSQWGESFLKLKYTPPPSASLKVVDHWTPWTDLARSGGQKPTNTRLAGVNATTEAMSRPVGSGMNMSLKASQVKSEINAEGKLSVRVYPNIAQGAWADEDWGSAGPACIFAIGVCIAAGKDGIAYPVKIANMGGTKPADLANPAMNCAKLLAPPVWLTMDPGQVSPCPPNPTALNFFPWGDTAHLHMTPVQFFDPQRQAWTIFAWGENNQLHKWMISKTGQMTYLAQSNEYASVEVRTTVQHGGMPGGFCSGSSSGSDPASAILVCTIPYKDANKAITNGRLLVYDPVDDKDGTLKVLWDSQAAGIPFLFNKFNPPVIDGGQIYVPNYNGGVDVYQLNQ